MVRANRWEIDEALSRPAELFEVAKKDGPQVVIAKSGRYTLTYEDLSRRQSAAEFLIKSGRDDEVE
jgi:hypothetical protein